MKEIVLYEDEENKEVVSIGEEAIYITWYDKGDYGILYVTHDYTLSIEDIKKIYHAIEEEG